MGLVWRRCNIVVPCLVVCACRNVTCTTKTTTFDAGAFFTTFVGTDAGTAAEAGPAPVGVCWTTGEVQCGNDGRASLCVSLGGRPIRHEWRTFKCEDCRRGELRQGVVCSDLEEGDVCSPSSTVSRTLCTKDRKSLFRCDWESGRWKVEPCPHGCTGDMRYTGASCL
jgi:hypothetical protein